MNERDRVIRGLYLLQAKLLEALAFNRPPEAEVAELATNLTDWWSARCAAS